MQEYLFLNKELLWVALLFYKVGFAHPPDGVRMTKGLTSFWKKKRAPEGAQNVYKKNKRRM